MNIGSIILFVRDMKAVTAFYGEAVGLSLDRAQPFPENDFFPL